MIEDPRELLAAIPEEPGVYRMISEGGALLYVGKAKSLRKRVASYFQRTGLSPRIRMMMAQVASVETTVTRSEAEALLLEANLIKGLSPRFNILYRDDKSYPYIVVTADPFARIAFHRGAFEKSARYFGPFPGAAAVRESIQLLQKVFRLRTCEDSVFANRSRPCLLHQIRRCSAPCVGLIAHDEYRRAVRMAEWVLQGKHSEVVGQLETAMLNAADRLDFERAAMLRDQIRSLQQVLHRTYASSGGNEDVDVVAAVAEGGTVCVNLAMVRGGRHLGDRPQFPANAQESTPEEALAAFLSQHYADFPAPQRILVDSEPGHELSEACAALESRSVRIGRPRSAGELAWMEMARKNAALAIGARLRESVASGARAEALRALLGLAEPPGRIECFDISHTGGEAIVGSCVVYAAGRMQRADYRRYNVRDIQPGDDYAAMRQVLSRRYERVAAGEGERPDLVLIDGGRGQLGCAVEVLADLGLDDLPVVGVAKGVERRPGEEEIVFPDGRASMHPGASHAGLHLIQEIRDEAHRFAVGGHRARRARARNVSRLEEIPGIGPVRRRRLLAQMGGWQGVEAATIEDLCRVDGIDRKLAELIYNHLH